VSLALHDDCVEPPLDDVADPLVPSVESLGVPAVEAPHPAREIGHGSLQQQVEVVRHEAVRVEAPLVAPDDLSQPVEEEEAVPVVEEDRLTGVASRRDVVERSGELDAKGSCRGQIMERRPDRRGPGILGMR